MPKHMQSDQAEINPSEPPPLLEWITAHSEALPDTPLRHEQAMAAEPSINLSGSNTLRQLLEERQCLAESLRAIKDRIDEIDTTIKNIMGDATIGMPPGWTICHPVMQRKAFAVKAGE